MNLLSVVYILVFIIFALVGYAVLQIKLFGMNVKDFWSFIEANQTLDKLYQYSIRYEKLSPQQQILYLNTIFHDIKLFSASTNISIPFIAIFPLSFL